MYLTLILTTILFHSISIFALPSPSPPLASLTPRDLHACSVFVQRWYANDFDQTYYSNGVQFWAQETVDAESQGSLLNPAQVGSYILYIWNARNPTGPTDAGELNFQWGSTTWDSDACEVVPVGVISAGFTSYSCDFECDE